MPADDREEKSQNQKPQSPEDYAAATGRRMGGFSHVMENLNRSSLNATSRLDRSNQGGSTGPGVLRESSATRPEAHTGKSKDRPIGLNYGHDFSFGLTTVESLFLLNHFGIFPFRFPSTMLANNDLPTQ
jgi:hypothetical protein